MDLHSLLTHLSHKGVKLSANGGSFLVDAPKGVLTSELRNSLAEHKAEILLLLHQSNINPSAASLPKIVPAPISQRYEPFPLTDMQHAFWVGRSGVLELGNVANHGYYEIECNNLDLERLNWALQKLIERHDMLRAVVLPDSQQQILKQVPTYQIEVLDLSGKDEAAVNSQLQAIRDRLSHQVLPADQWPLFEFRATRLDRERARLHVSYDLQIFDAWSLFRLFDEWFQLYQNPQVELPPLKLSFRDYVLAEQALPETQLYKRSQEYWLSRLDSFPPAPDLPLAKNPSEIKQHQCRRYAGRLDRTEWQQLKHRAAEAGLTPSGALLAAFAEILTVWSKSPEFTLNLALFNRLPLHPQVNDILGDFSSVTLLTVDNSALEPFSDRAVRLQKQLWQDLEHRYFSGVRVTRELSRRKGTAPNAMPVVFTSTLGFGSLGQETLTFSHFGELVYGISQASQAWMDIQVWEEKETLTFNWDVVEELFPTGLIGDMFEAYCRFLKQLATSKSAWVETTRQLLPPAQLAQRDAINATDAPVPDALLHTLFAAQVQARANESAVVSSRRTLTYQELSELSNQLGHKLRSLGATPNQLVAVVMEKGWEQIVAVMGIMAAGAAYVPIDPGLPQERLLYLLNSSEADIILTQSWLNEKLAWPKKVHRLCIDNEDLAAQSQEPLQPVQTPDDLAYVIYTSGSTGFPKGVMIAHRGAVNAIVQTNHCFNIKPDDRVLALTALNHDMSVYDIFGILAAGGAIVMPDAVARKDPAHWVELMRKENITIWNSVPAMMEMLLEYVGDRSELLPQSLRWAFLGGDWLSVTLPDRLQTLIKDVRVVSVGGPTETTLWNIWYPVKTVDPTWKSIPYGKPIANTKYYVLNEALEDCPTWVPGELCCAGVGIAKGYWRNEEKTCASFITHPRTGERIYRTGDLGRYLPDGQIEFLGRVDYQVKIGGYRIELGEIEATLKQYPGVRDAVTVAVTEAGQSRQLVAYVVPEKEQADALFEVEAADKVETQRLWKEVVERGAKKVQQFSDAVNPKLFAAFWQQQLDPLQHYAVSVALRKFGIYTQPDEEYSLDELMQQCQIQPRYRKWLSRNLAILVDLGWLQVRGEKIANAQPLPAHFPPELLTKVRSEAASILGYTQNAVDLFMDVIENLADMLTQDISFQLVTSEETAGIYEREFQFVNNVIKEILRSIGQSWKPGYPLRILEIGAGTGAVTKQALPMLPPERTTYVYTDISQYFLQMARQHFGNYAFLETGTLDLEREPLEQGYQLHSFDVVIASGVVHATRSIRESLGHIRSLLVPAGVLLMVEPTKRNHLWELIMGLLQGFDRFEDQELRQHPLLSREQWQQVLLEEGFTDYMLFNNRGSIDDFLGRDLLLVQAPLLIQRFKQQELRSFLQEKLPKYMVPSSYVCLDALPLTSNGKVDRQALLGAKWVTPIPDTAFVAPRTSLQKTIAEIWAEVLEHNRIGIHDNFFQLGGDSLLATQIVSRLREKLQIELTVQSVLEATTLASLAECIEQIYQTTQKLQAPLGDVMTNRVEIEL